MSLAVTSRSRRWPAAPPTEAATGPLDLRAGDRRELGDACSNATAAAEGVELEDQAAGIEPLVDRDRRRLVVAQLPALADTEGIPRPEDVSRVLAALQRAASGVRPGLLAAPERLAGAADVERWAAVDPVRSRPADERVAARTAADEVVRSEPVHRVVSPEGDDDVCAPRAPEVVGPGGADDRRALAETKRLGLGRRGCGTEGRTRRSKRERGQQERPPPDHGRDPILCEVRLCLSCGHENADDARFCSQCATPLDEAAATREERKVVTCLFCDLVGFTARAEQLDPEDVRAVLQPYHARLRADLERFGGTVEKFIGDAVMAIFGAPVAHEDDPERAVRAALAIRDGLAEDELDVRIGITTGEALITLGARPEAGEGMAAGDVVNTAARLQAAAPTNAILVDETTYRSTERAIDYRDAVPVEAKGKAEPVPVWEALSARARVGVERVGGAQLVGRDQELTLLREALGRVIREREPQLATLVGVPGIGKSRLVYELFQTIETGAYGLVFWRHGRSLPYGEGITFWALGEMVKAQAGILESDSPEQASVKLGEAVARFVDAAADATWVERHLRPLAGVETDEAWTGDRREEAFAAWRRFLEAIADERALVLVFEDLQWADDALLDFVDYLAEWASGVPILVLAPLDPSCSPAGRSGAEAR